MSGLGGRARRSAQLAKLSAAAGKGLLGAQINERRGRTEAAAASHEQLADQVFAVLGGMKGAAMKLGQMLSFMDLDIDDETTAVYQRKLAGLQAAAPATDTVAVEAVIAEQFGAPATEVFAHWERRPLAVASIGQVHRARLHDGTEVIAKVQHPGVAEAVEADLRNVATFLPIGQVFAGSIDVKAVWGELRESIAAELDYQHEANFQQAFRDRYEGHPFIRIPRVYHDWCRPRVLVTDYIAGRSFSQMLETTTPAERDRIGEIIFRFVFGSLYRFRLFNADPHPGNFIFPGDGTVAFIDFGSSKAFPSHTRAKLRRVHRAVIDSDLTALQATMEDAGLKLADAEIDMERMLGWFRLAAKPMLEDKDATYSPEYARDLIVAGSDPRSEYWSTLRKLAMPADYVLLNRIQYGLNSLLARIGPTANWFRIMDELSEGTPPATPLGEAEAEFIAHSAYADLGLETN